MNIFVKLFRKLFNRELESSQFKGTDFIGWSKNGQIHRDNDEPAIIYINGEKWWYKNGDPHREGNKPAIIKPNGEINYYVEGKPHRTNGPSFTINSLRRYNVYHIHGTRYTQLGYYQELIRIKKLKIVGNGDLFEFSFTD